MRIFLDANVLFSAAWQEGRARALFALAEKAGATLLTSPHVREEARRNLEAKRPQALPYFEELLGRTDPVPEAPPALVEKARGLGLPLKDAPVLAAAWSARADALVTGDRRHFGHWFGKRVQGVRVHTPGEVVGLLLERLEEAGGP